MNDAKIPLTDGQSMDAYVAWPANTPAPAIIVIQEIFGVNQEIRDRCDQYARDGYLAIAPDLFHRLEPNVQLTDKTQGEWDKALDLMKRFNIDQGVRDLDDTLAFARARKDCDGFVANIGFCLGGKLTYLMAARTDVDASVGYYGVGIQDMLDEMKGVKTPLMLHIAGQDKFVPKDAQDAIIAEAAQHKNVETHRYPNDDHAFARKGGEHYSEASAKLANERSLQFLETAHKNR